MAQLRTNRVKHKLQRGDVTTVLLGHNTADMIDLLGPLGFDGMWLEGEHGPVDFGDLPNLTRACDLWGMTSLARVNVNVPGVIYRTLDGGVQGIAVPHVNTADEARAVVDAAKFAPVGSRGMFVSRQGYGVPDYLARANDETLVVVLIEDVVAIQNLPEILTVDHIDVFSVAPGDLAQSMGYLGQTEHPRVTETIDRAIGQITGAGKNAGMLVNDTNVDDYINKGVRFLCTTWLPWVHAGGGAYLERVAASAQRSSTPA